MIDREAANFYALLIGIDYYLPQKLPDRRNYHSLAGCVRDINLIEEFLQIKLGMPSENILKLTASNQSILESPELPEQLPTYENMVAAFLKLLDVAQPKDQVYIHYSGHGGRTPTQFPELKGTNSFDESLVPTDISNPEARYLRDIELAYILKKMVDKSLVVTLVLDSCHSGGMNRGDATVRGIDGIDPTLRPKQSLVASNEELVKVWQNLTKSETRNVSLGNEWLPEPKGYVLLAACRPQEFASEYAFDGKEKNGVLTYWLLDSFKQLKPGFTYQLIHNYIVSKVHREFKYQTPQLYGEGNRVVFGSDRIQSNYAINVMLCDQAKQRVKLNTGQAQAVRKGTQFVIYPLSTIDFTQVHERLALVEITELGGTNSWAKIIKPLSPKPIKPGDRAVLLDAGSLRLRRKVRLLPPSNLQNKALQQLDQAIEENSSGFLQLADSDEAAQFTVAINSEEEYEIWDAAGLPIPNLNPAVRIDESDATERIVQRLVHLTKYHNVWQLENTDPLSPLAGKLEVELLRAQPDYESGDRPEPQPFNDPGNTPTLLEGDWMVLRVKNASSQFLNITILALQPDWSVTQVYPSDCASWVFDPSQEMPVPLQASLPDGYQQGTDIIKVFATVGVTDFRWLELPALDRSATESKNQQRKPTNSLEEFLGAVVEARLSIPIAIGEWETATVEVRTKTPETTIQ